MDQVASDGKTYASGKMLASVRDGVGLITFNRDAEIAAMREKGAI
jgi:hypothetical protein